MFSEELKFDPHELGVTCGNLSQQQATTEAEESALAASTAVQSLPPHSAVQFTPM